MKGAVVVNGYYRSRPYDRQVQRILEEFRLKNVDVHEYVHNEPVSNETRFSFDFAVFLDKDVAFACLLESKGVKVFNNSYCLEVADDKGKTASVLAKNDKIRQQKTILRPKRYTYQTDPVFLRQVGEELGFPLVAKESRGSLGEQVYLVQSEQELREIDEKIGVKEGIFQSYRKESYGKSIRVIVVGGKVLGAMELSCATNFKSNAYQGGTGKAIELRPEWEKAAVEVAKTLRADYLGVDLFADEPVVIEANSNAFFESFEEKTDINVAKAYIDYIIEKM